MRKLCACALTALTLLAAFSLSACSKKKDDGGTVKNDYPVTVGGVEIERCPQNVISLSPSITDIIYTLGSDAQLIGVSDQCLPEKELPRFGSAALPDTDAILGSGADLVLAAEALPSGDRQRLADKGIPVVTVPAGASYDELPEQYAAVARAMSGAVTGEKNAQNTFSRVDGRIKTVKNTLKGKATPAALLLGNGIVATPDTFAGEMLAFAGGRNAAQDGKNYELSYEKLAKANPAAIFCPAELTDAVRADKYLKETDAVKAGRVYAVSPYYFERPGENLALGVELMAAHLYPELIKMPVTPETEAASEPAESGAQAASAAQSGAKLPAESA